MPPHARRRTPRGSSLRVVRPRSFPAPPWITTGLVSFRVAIGSRVEDSRRPLSDFERPNCPAACIVRRWGPTSSLWGPGGD